MSASWKASVPIMPLDTCPVIAIKDAIHVCIAIPVIRLVAPGPEVETQTAPCYLAPFAITPHPAHAA